MEDRILHQCRLDVSYLVKGWQETSFYHWITIGALFAPVTGTGDDHTSDKRLTEITMVRSGGRQIYGNTCRKREKWSLTNEKYFQCSRSDAAADAGTKTVPMVNTI